MSFSQILGKNRGCGLYSVATCSPENTVIWHSVGYIVCVSSLYMLISHHFMSPMIHTTGIFHVLFGHILESDYVLFSAD